MALTLAIDDCLMEDHIGPCEHRWRYFVNVDSRSIRVRECERCGRRAVVPTHLAPLPRPKYLEPRLSA
ncbi:MAG: hypothetical protein HS107_11485 [Thermoflexaceae bacterium]|nr:hypothetical protein [Thermoflexaceae bacterium]